MFDKFQSYYNVGYYEKLTKTDNFSKQPVFFVYDILILLTVKVNRRSRCKYILRLGHRR